VFVSVSEWKRNISYCLAVVIFRPLHTKQWNSAAQAVHIAQCANMCAAQPARVQMMQRHGPACERDRWSACYGMVGGAGSSISSAHCTVHCTRGGILCSSALLRKLCVLFSHMHATCPTDIKPPCIDHGNNIRRGVLAISEPFSRSWELYSCSAFCWAQRFITMRTKKNSVALVR
jgi:hypothetical protein